MLAELKAKSQLTIPKQVVSKLGISVGDQFDVIVENGNIVLVPVVVYPKAKLTALHELATKARQDVRAGETEAFDDIDQALQFLHREDSAN
ncbi:MAG: AbrB/MazE/SpoVT family DNA-binding domain-containing protein [Actinomycetaceae bacterium]|nr:AbrB/MazE/SpoVT family DNA-binding domain-containing protein [Arcanobacterium sp.]MDD7686942.1 AbrB/MazE/SpoVT family DNA-binding domain-containing protein [Actinomycetaceae bacterium]MDY5273519.1 AbrB/MazE/SpoVT family DNA-binding domain-containing protein [Arcanobacterium sp.]